MIHSSAYKLLQKKKKEAHAAFRTALVICVSLVSICNRMDKNKSMSRSLLSIFSVLRIMQRWFRWALWITTGPLQFSNKYVNSNK